MKGTIRDVEQFGRVLQHQTLDNSEDKKIIGPFGDFQAGYGPQKSTLLKKVFATFLFGHA